MWLEIVAKPRFRFIGARLEDNIKKNNQKILIYINNKINKQL